jgi:hypothetical protein
MGVRNQGLWKEFEVGKVVRGEQQKTFFSHPITGAKIWVFADFPHLLKLLRNHILDDGITFRDGFVLKKKTFLDTKKSKHSGPSYCSSPRSLPLTKTGKCCHHFPAVL